MSTTVSLGTTVPNFTVETESGTLITLISTGDSLVVEVNVVNAADVVIYLHVVADLDGNGAFAADEMVSAPIAVQSSAVHQLAFDNVVTAPTGSDIPVEVFLAAETMESIESVDMAGNDAVLGEVEAFSVEVCAPTGVVLSAAETGERWTLLF